MKTIEDYLKFPYRLELAPDPEEGGFVASYPDLPGCLSSGETVEEAEKNAKDALRTWIAAALESGMQVPECD